MTEGLPHVEKYEERPAQIPSNFQPDKKKKTFAV